MSLGDGVVDMADPLLQLVEGGLLQPCDDQPPAGIKANPPMRGSTSRIRTAGLHGSYDGWTIGLSEAEWDSTIAVNLKSCFNWIQAVAPHMLAARYGRIVSMSSLNAHSGGVTAAVSRFSYAAAKAGIIGMTRALAKELGPDITVNCVCPGIIRTDALASAGLLDREAKLIEGVALKRVGTPEDVAELVAFLTTVEPCFITGQDIIIDGFQWNI
jgi:3-oxoacyl-[acyl-carrier protein] reductase